MALHMAARSSVTAPFVTAAPNHRYQDGLPVSLCCSATLKPESAPTSLTLRRLAELKQISSKCRECSRAPGWLVSTYTPQGMCRMLP